LDLEDATLDHLAELQGRLRDPDVGVRWADRENLHLTLIFLGDVPDETLPRVCDLAAGVAADIEPFEWDVRGVQCVPPAGPLRMIWAGVADATGRLATLAEGLRVALTGMGLHEEERQFRPHITLARVKGDRQAARRGGSRSSGDRHGGLGDRAGAAGGIRQAAREFTDADFGVQFAEELIVYGSQLTPDGPIYTPTARVKLGG